MQNVFTSIINSISVPSLRAEIDIHSLDYDFPQSTALPIVRSSPERTQVAPMPDKQGKPVLSTATSSCSPASNAPSFQAQYPSSGASQQAAGSKERTATKKAVKDVTMERAGSRRELMSPALESARKIVVVKHYVEAIQIGDVKAVKNAIADEISYGTLDHETMKTALWLAIKSKNAAMIDLIVPVTSHSAKLEVMMFMLNLKAGQRAALMPGVDAIMKSYHRQEAGSRPCSNAEKAAAQQVRNYLN